MHNLDDKYPTRPGFDPVYLWVLNHNWIEWAIGAGRYGSTAIRIILILSVRGSTLYDVRFWRIKSIPALKGLNTMDLSELNP